MRSHWTHWCNFLQPTNLLVCSTIVWLVIQIFSFIRKLTFSHMVNFSWSLLLFLEELCCNRGYWILLVFTIAEFPAISGRKSRRPQIACSHHQSVNMMFIPFEWFYPKQTCLTSKEFRSDKWSQLYCESHSWKFGGHLFLPHAVWADSLSVPSKSTVLD